MISPETRIGGRGKVGIPGQEDAVNIEPGVPHPEIEGVGTGGRNTDANRSGRSGGRIGPSPSVELLNVDAGIDRACAVETDIHSGGGRVPSIAPYPNKVSAGIRKGDGVIDLGAGSWPRRRDRVSGAVVSRAGLDVTRAGKPRRLRVSDP